MCPFYPKGGFMLEIESTNEHYKTVRQQLDDVYGIERVLVLSDLHIPFHLDEDIINIIDEHKDQISTIVFAGDILDCFGVSSFPKDYRLPLTTELSIASKFLRKIDKRTPNVKKVLFFGNHEYRFTRYLAKQDYDISTFFDTNILQLLKTGFTYRSFDNKKKSVPGLSDNFTVLDSWYYQHHDVIFAHPSNFSSVPMKTAHNTYKYFSNNGFDFSAICIGHTHKLGSFFIWNKMVSELGCLCRTMDYTNHGNINYIHQTNGYGLYVFKDKQVLLDQSGPKLLTPGDGNV